MKKENTKEALKQRTVAPGQKGWRKFAPWVILAIMTLWVVSGLRTTKNTTAFHVEEFSKMPVLLNGRVQPWDSVAKNSLLMLRGKSTVLLTDRPQEELGFFEKAKLKKMTAMEWLLEAMTQPDKADTRHIFRIDNAEVLNALKLPVERKFFTFNEVKQEFDTIREEARRIQEQRIEEQARTAFQKGAMKVNFAVNLYFQIKNSIRPEHMSSYAGRVINGQSLVTPGLAALEKAERREEHDAEALQGIMGLYREYDFLSKVAYPLIIPPKTGKAQKDWANIGTVLKETLRGGEIPKPVIAYVKMADAYGSGSPEAFNQAVNDHRSFLAGTYTKELRKGAQENFYNHYAPFIKSIAVYLVAFLLGCAFWMTWSEWTRRSAFYLIVLATIVHTSGLIFRMYLEARPPVTNLYSSAIFVGWGAVLLGIVLERIWRDGIGLVTASAVGVTTLIIAHNLSLGGDTMEMLRAVLDTNFWLATHVVMITLGYSAMFVAGFLAILFVVRGFFSSSLGKDTARALNRMVYGIVCFATLFSFVGTILGGIWADQSWGRFWGWDPKENGALLIVIWCAVILHARWGGLIRDRGLMAMAIFGNVITAFSWFGVNMLGVGLHSYGFMDAAFKWLMGFNLTQLVFIALALTPLSYWKSFREGSAAGKPKQDDSGAGLGQAKPAAA
jgi:ABC-type transport system involved in cytochrome c biogenesis permease subunit